MCNYQDVRLTVGFVGPLPGGVGRLRRHYDRGILTLSPKGDSRPGSVETYVQSLNSIAVFTLIFLNTCIYQASLEG